MLHQSGARRSRTMQRRFVTRVDVQKLPEGSAIDVGPSDVVTASAWDAAAARRVEIRVRPDTAAASPPGPPAAGAPPSPAHAPPPAEPRASAVGPVAAVLAQPVAPSPSREAEAALLEEARSAPDLVIVSAFGRNRPGVLAAVTGKVSELGGNIQDINQKIVQSYFHLIMIIDLSGSAAGFHRFKAGLESLATADAGMFITVQHERVFRAMHRV
ncbi:MAG: ACT domain-containing protein [Planctomycetes bacterium]|nr:ACT domain-containing protein [Planctomycetota bacterium]